MAESARRARTEAVKADAHARYCQRFEIDASALPPQVARKHHIDDTVLQMAYTHLKTYEARRAANRLR